MCLMIGLLLLMTNSSHIDDVPNHVTSMGDGNENEAFYSVVFFLYRILPPIIFVVVIFILLWFIVLSIFR